MNLSLSELAKLTGGNIVRGKLDSLYKGISALDQAGPEDVSFLGNVKYHNQFIQSAAGACLVLPGVTDGPEGMALIETPNPTLAFSTVISHFAQLEHKFEPGIHPAAIVDSSARLDPSRVRIHAGAVIMAGAVIGDGTEIYPNAVIGQRVSLGRDCLIYQNVSIRECCVIGNRVIMQPGVVIGADGYGYEFSGGQHQKIPQVGIVEIGDDVEIGANSCIDRARFGKTVIGEGTKIDNLVQIGHNAQIGKHCLIIAFTGIAGSAKLGNYVTCAAQVGVAGHLEVGDKAVLATRTCVISSLEGGHTYMGFPAQPMKMELKEIANGRRLSKLIADVKQLKKRLGEDQS